MVSEVSVKRGREVVIEQITQKQTGSGGCGKRTSGPIAFKGSPQVSTSSCKSPLLSFYSFL